jgi:cytochrome P450
MAGHAVTTPGLYYDPYDFDIDADPYPVWRRLRDDAPLYYNDAHQFFALSRYDDIAQALTDWSTYRSGKGSILELIRADVPLPSGLILFEDPPRHDVHRGLVSRVFTPRRMNALEARVREFTVRCLDPLVGESGFDLVADLGAQMPMRTIGYLLGIPESDQEALRDRLDASLRLDESAAPASFEESGAMLGLITDYVDWRAANPADDLMTELINAEFEDEDGTTRQLTHDEVRTFVSLLAGAGNETTTRLIGWAGTLLAAHADQRRELANDRALVPGAVEEILRYEAPSPVQARYVARDVHHHGQTVPEGSVMLLLNGAANRDERHFSDPDRFDIHRRIDRHLSFGYGIHFCLGAALARLEGRVALEEILTRWPDWQIDWERAQQARTSTVRGWERLPIVVA